MPAYITLTSLEPTEFEQPAIFTIGGFEIQQGDKTIQFDFEEYSAHAEQLEDGRLIVEVRLKSLDEDTFPECAEITQEMCELGRFTEIYYECYGDPEEKNFIPLKADYFKLEYDGLPGGKIDHEFTSEQLGCLHLAPCDSCHKDVQQQELMDIASQGEKFCFACQAEWRHSNKEVVTHGLQQQQQ